MPRLQVVIASTRPGRAGLPIGNWIYERAQRHGAFEVELIDLAEVNLPFLDEPNHPRLRRYTKQHTKDWSARIESGDAFIFVTPEYNYSMPPTLLNALDFLFFEWHHKPAGFVSYGGMAGGSRSVQMSKQVITTLGMTPMMQTVAIPFYNNFIIDGVFQPNDAMEKGAEGMLGELAQMEAALSGLRQQVLKAG